MRTFGGTVAFDVPVEVAFDYLVDPVNRPAWQSSLKRVDGVTGEPRVGQRWTDVTVPGIRPAMETTELVRPSSWAEVGRWHGVSADLRLAFTPTAAGCSVAYRFRISGPGPLRWLGAAASVVSVPAVGADLRRAASISSDQWRATKERGA